jgi:hypothetical protein
MDTIFPDFAFQLPEFVSATGAENTQAGTWFKQSAVGGATQKHGLTVHECIRVPIKWYPEMRAAIQVGCNNLRMGTCDQDVAPIHVESARRTNGNVFQLAKMHQPFWGSGQCLGKIGQQVCSVFDAYGEPYHGIRDAH